jgi:Cu(I)/Ag(I) efflux system membrane fusion protein
MEDDRGMNEESEVIGMTDIGAVLENDGGKRRGRSRWAILVVIVGVAILSAGAGLTWKAYKSGAFGSATAAVPTVNGREVEYYTCSMHPYIREPKPGNCPVCGMKLQPVYKNTGATAAVDAPGTVHITDEEAHRLGIRTTTVRRGALSATVRAPGRVEVNEESLHHVHLKIEGWVDELFVKAVGAFVRRDDPLFSIYSPQIVAAQEEYLVALRARKNLEDSDSEVTGGVDVLVAASRDRFRLWDIPTETIRELEATRQVQRTVTLRAHASGYVMNRSVTAGQKVMPDDDLYVIADLSSVWIIADIAERDMARVKEGRTVLARFAGRPGKTFRGVVTYIYPYLDETTRTVRVRVEISNPDLVLRPGMFGEIEIEGGAADNRLLAPSDAVMITGERNLVFVENAPGVFSPVDVKIGEAGGGFYEILEGLSEGDTIVERGAFFLDSESKLRMTGSAGAHAGHGKSEGAATDAAATPPSAVGEQTAPATRPAAAHEGMSH